MSKSTQKKQPHIQNQHSDQEGNCVYIGLDVHRDTIVVAVARSGRERPASFAQIRNTQAQIQKLRERLIRRFPDSCRFWCYEAGPCGYVLHHQLTALGECCQVVAPSRIPQRPADRIKTDRRDANKLAEHLRAGTLTAVHIPDADQEAMRDLTRARDDMKRVQLKTRQQLNAFVLRHGYVFQGRTRWSKAHLNWLESLKFEHAGQQIALQEYIEAQRQATERVKEMDRQIDAACKKWSLEPVVRSLMALRGIDQLAATIIVAELGDISRFTKPSQLMSYLGLVPGEYSSGSRRRQGAITKTGNRQVRRLLVECAWSYRFPARNTMHLKRKAAQASDDAKATAWRAQKRLCGRYRDMIERGKDMRIVCVAIARELAGFIWDIVRRELEQLQPAAH